MSKKVEVKCRVCGKIEYVNPSRAKKYATCSRECMGKYYHTKFSNSVIKICPECGKEFKVKPSHANKRKYCSLECMYKGLPERFLGSGNPNYKGRDLNSDGYKKDTSNSKFTEHRETVKKVLNIKDIPSVFIVHHKDGDKHSNDPKNLILLTHKEHTWLHKNLGNYVFKALFSGQLSIDTVLSWVDKEHKDFVKYALTTDCTQQSAVVKQGELLENPEFKTGQSAAELEQ